jgi:hypothetical protein
MTGERQNPRRQAGPPDRPSRPRPAPRRKLHGFRRRCIRRGRLFDERSQLAQIPRAGERGLVDVGLKRILERHHQLDAIE